MFIYNVSSAGINDVGKMYKFKAEKNIQIYLQVIPGVFYGENLVF